MEVSAILRDIWAFVPVSSDAIEGQGSEQCITKDCFFAISLQCCRYLTCSVAWLRAPMSCSAGVWGGWGAKKKTKQKSQN